MGLILPPDRSTRTVQAKGPRFAFPSARDCPASGRTAREKALLQPVRPIVASICPCGSSVGRNTVPGFSTPKGLRLIGM